MWHASEESETQIHGHKSGHMYSIYHIRKDWTSRCEYPPNNLSAVMGMAVHISLIWTVDVGQIFLMCESFLVAACLFFKGLLKLTRIWQEQ